MIAVRICRTLKISYFLSPIVDNWHWIPYIEIISTLHKAVQTNLADTVRVFPPEQKLQPH